MCTKCKLRRGTNPVSGRGNSVNPQFMFIGEAPGRNEEKTGEPFVGVAGKIFNRWIEKLGITDYYVTNAVKCRPPNNRAPQFRETQTCKNWLFDEIKLVNPRTVVCLGRIAMFAMDGKRGYFTKKLGKPVFTMYHPMASRYDPKKETEESEHLKKLKNYITLSSQKEFDLDEFLKKEEEEYGE